MYHFIGIGGAGMSVIAEILAARGEQVQGSDQVDSLTVTRLRDGGVRVFIGHDANHLDTGVKTVVISSAVKADNPELLAARERGLRILHRSEALAEAASADAFIAVAGAHGKTTTSGMLVRTLQGSGLDPSYAVGSPIAPHPSGGRSGTTPIFVAEADESDGSFLNYRPQVCIITNIEPDHLDHYGSAEALVDAYRRFAESSKLVIICHDDPGAARLADHLEDRGSRIIRYGQNQGADLLIRDIEPGRESSRAVLEFDGFSQPIEVGVPGLHNVLNAAAVWAAARAVGISATVAATGLATFSGTERRFTLRGSAGGVRVYDDYAHHPTEIAALVQTARQVSPTGRLLLIFQPHLYSRTENFAGEFAQALAGADRAWVTPIYRARESERHDVTPATITDHEHELIPVDSVAEAVEQAASQVAPGDLIVTVGAGDITSWGAMVLAALESQ